LHFPHWWVALFFIHHSVEGPQFILITVQMVAWFVAVCLEVQVFTAATQSLGFSNLPWVCMWIL
jgi:hypothetical protein